MFFFPYVTMQLQLQSWKGRPETPSTDMWFRKFECVSLSVGIFMAQSFQWTRPCASIFMLHLWQVWHCPSCPTTCLTGIYFHIVTIACLHLWRFCPENTFLQIIDVLLYGMKRKNSDAKTFFFFFFLGDKSLVILSKVGTARQLCPETACLKIQKLSNGKLSQFRAATKDYFQKKLWKILITITQSPKSLKDSLFTTINDKEMQRILTFKKLKHFYPEKWLKQWTDCQNSWELIFFQ